jgi:transcriptional regulator with XRE-family HTH domain
VSNVSELGLALRGWRDRITPASVGLPAGGQRRAAGLRREELALLAGVSADYITRLEQGRAAHPSAQVLAALARALRLSEPERRHLLTLAGQPPPAAGHIRSSLTPGVQRLLDQLDGAAVGVYDAAWTLVAWNALWAALMGDPSALHGRGRNVLWRHFTGQPGRVTHTPQQEAAFEASAVADLRSATARYPKDANLRQLVTDLCAVSTRFAGLWDARAVGTHEEDRKTIHHPHMGPLTLDCDVLTAYGSDLRIVVYTAAPGSDAADRLRLLAVIGTQDMTGDPGRGMTRP